MIWLAVYLFIGLLTSVGVILCERKVTLADLIGTLILCGIGWGGLALMAIAVGLTPKIKWLGEIVLWEKISLADLEHRAETAISNRRDLNHLGGFAQFLSIRLNESDVTQFIADKQVARAIRKNLTACLVSENNLLRLAAVQIGRKK